MERGVPLFDEVHKMVVIVAVSLITQSLKRIGGIDEASVRFVLTKQQEAPSAIDMLVNGAPHENVSEEAMRRLERQLE